MKSFFPFKRFSVEGGSMAPAFQSGERVLVFRWGAIRPGDTVVFCKGGMTMIKRAAARVGERWMMRGDNRSASTDSLDFGEVSNGEIIGKVVAKY